MKNFKLMKCIPEIQKEILYRDKLALIHTNGDDGTKYYSRIFLVLHACPFRAENQQLKKIPLQTKLIRNFGDQFNFLKKAWDKTKNFYGKDSVSCNSKWGDRFLILSNPSTLKIRYY